MSEYIDRELLLIGVDGCISALHAQAKGDPLQEGAIKLVEAIRDYIALLSAADVAPVEALLLGAHPRAARGGEAMIKTRAEAIATLRKMPIRVPPFGEAHNLDGLEAVKLAIPALFGPSREAVERAWLRAPDTSLAVEQLEGGGTRYSAGNTCTACGSKTPIGHFCHNCGAALDLTGVSLVLDRLREVMGP